MPFYSRLYYWSVVDCVDVRMVVATIQSSINKMVPKTSYIKMIDIWLLYSFNIIIVMMIIHTYMDTVISNVCGL